MDLIIRNGFVLGADGTFERKDSCTHEAGYV